MQKHRHEWKYYDGALGYESLTCKKCGVDINDLPYKPKVMKYVVSVVQVHGGTYAVYLTETGPFGETSIPVKKFVLRKDAEIFAKKIRKYSDKEKEQIIKIRR